MVMVKGQNNGSQLGDGVVDVVVCAVHGSAGDGQDDEGEGRRAYDGWHNAANSPPDRVHVVQVTLVE
jgi:hypothetical protein